MLFLGPLLIQTMHNFNNIWHFLWVIGFVSTLNDQLPRHPQRKTLSLNILKTAILGE